MNTHRKLIVLFTALVLPLMAQAQTPAAQVVLVTGSAKVGARALSAGNKVNAGETIVTGPNSYANLKFADGGRILLRPNTEFTVEAYNYTAAPAAATAPAPAPGVAPPAAAPSASAGDFKSVSMTPAAAPGQTAFFRLLRGGFRAISGLIGKTNRQSYRVTTSVATIGIRGTDYEVQLCSSDCPTDGMPKTSGMEAVQLAASDLSGLQLAQAGGGGPAGGGLVLATNEGSVVLQTPRGEFVVDVGQVALTLANGQTFKLPAIPDMLLLQQTPSPQDCN